MSLLVPGRLDSLSALSSIFVLTATSALVCAIQPARAVCSPTSGNVSCTGTTVNQNAGGQGFNAIFSNVTVGSDASVIGSNVGMFTLVSTVTNAGTISGGVAGIVVGNQTVIYNSGVISGLTGIESGPIAYAPTAEITNSGTIVGTGGFAINMNRTSALTLLPGSKIIGQIVISNVAQLSVSAPNQNLTFVNSLGAMTVTIGAGLPGVASGNTLVTVDPTIFGVMDRTLLAFTDAVTGLAGSRTSAASTAGGGALGFAAADSTTSSVDDAFAQVMGYAKAPTDAVWFKNPTVTASDGTTVWARGFTGHRVQQADGISLRNVTDFYGGAIGIDKRVAPDLLLGAYGGGGSTLTTIDPAMGDARSDIGFGGVYGRKDIGKTFIDFGLLGGATSNRSSRLINNNLAAGGLETATANFGGWFVNPELALGYRHAIAPGWTLTPTARVRYLAAGYDGYTESGSTANLTVGNRTLQNMEERGELNLTYTTQTEAVRFQLGGYGGVIGQQRVGDSDVNATLLGQALAFAAPGQASIAGGFVGTTLDWRFRSGVGLYGGIEYTALTDHSSTVTGRAGLRVGF
ncbi:autotransporter outer membrane beta-barrel domain-containing protein [Bradyrhizobium sp. Pa8]|uniref:autotransporter outer membrane beta-barrel domain-containing protein n=1 Tax=Bradyrhizobium sp. Pa8 TaxID=3386552 RepID=UPI00403F57D7